jgi:hypothetical protein
MPNVDITKKYRISSQLAIVASRAVNVSSVVTDIKFKCKVSGLSLRIAPIKLDLKDKTITMTLLAGQNAGTANFGSVPSEWFEYIEATFAHLLGKYLNKDLS